MRFEKSQKLAFANGDKYEGLWVKDKMHGTFCLWGEAREERAAQAAEAAAGEDLRSDSCGVHVVRW